MTNAASRSRSSAHWCSCVEAQGRGAQSLGQGKLPIAYESKAPCQARSAQLVAACKHMWCQQRVSQLMRFISSSLAVAVARLGLLHREACCCSHTESCSG